MNQTTEKKTALRFGTWTFLVGALILAIVLMLNLILAVLPIHLTAFDITSQRLYTLSETTEQLVSQLQTDITITVVCETGKEDSLLKDTLKRYRALSDRIKVEYVDPMLDPSRVGILTENEYDALLTEENESDNNSLIVHSEKRYCVVRYDDLGYTEYSPEELYYAMLSGETAKGTTYYNAENQITAALDFVTATEIPIYYVIGGHAESELSQSLQNEISLSNIQLKSLDLAAKGEIPADAKGLIICNPSRDYTDIEVARLRVFLENGGDLMLLTRQSNLTYLPKFLSLMAEYGVTAKDDTVLTDNQSYHAYGYGDHVLYFSPNTTDQDFLEKGSVRLPSAHPLLISTDLPKTMKVYSVLKIADGAYLQKEGKAAANADGYPLVVAVESTKNNQNTKIVWVSSDQLITDERYNVSGNNHRYFLQLMSYLSEKDTTISIDAIRMSGGKIIVSETQGILWGILMVGIIPGAFATGGILYYRKRRKR
jgi:ABC-2 type transport system permease protein